VTGHAAGNAGQFHLEIETICRQCQASQKKTLFSLATLVYSLPTHKKCASGKEIRRQCQASPARH
jgi:hypothetical protein